MRAYGHTSHVNGGCSICWLSSTGKRLVLVFRVKVCFRVTVIVRNSLFYLVNCNKIILFLRFYISTYFSIIMFSPLICITLLRMLVIRFVFNFMYCCQYYPATIYSAVYSAPAYSFMYSKTINQSLDHQS